MPAKDKTGPNRKGPGTGRGLGICSPEDLKKYKDMGIVDKNPNRPYDGRGQGKGPGLRGGRGRQGK